MSTKRPTLREMQMIKMLGMKRGGALRLSGQGLVLSGQGLVLSGQGLTAKQIQQLQKVKALVIRKQQQGAGVSAIIGSIFKFVEKLGIHLTRTLWDSSILPILRRTILKNSSQSLII